MINKGKRVIDKVGPVSRSYGDQSPSDDVPVLGWQVGDVREYQSTNNSPAAQQRMKWVCIAVDTPEGTWQLIRIPAVPPIIMVPLVFNGLWPNLFSDGAEVTMAPSSVDWQEPGEALPSPNIFPVLNTDLLLSTGAGPTFLALQVWINKQSWTTPVVDGITFRVYLHDGTLLATGTVTADTVQVGKFNPISTALAAGIIDSNNAGLYATMAVDAGAGDGEIHLNAYLGLYRDFQLVYAEVI